ncbi:hypothetical protein Pmani_023176 [Petrolisthes manimaculis]|uniref:Uncharacterized protein n=1 Tax=Petrolisthes manimaculis TaxID=1843537 RepID=A0AAE1U3N3_9EUCA|nr:hypothetical protein Pmani_023176 [Petrolisthes manimaculis]
MHYGCLPSPEAKARVQDQFVQPGITFAAALLYPVTVRQGSLPSSSTSYDTWGSTSRGECSGNSEVVQPKHGCTSFEEAPV